MEGNKSEDILRISYDSQQQNSILMPISFYLYIYIYIYFDFDTKSFTSFLYVFGCFAIYRNNKLFVNRVTIKFCDTMANELRFLS